MKELGYITGGSGFIGNAIRARMPELTSIPHDKIDSILLKPYDHFFFLSAYGNMSHHTDDSQILKANVEDLVRVVRYTNFTDIKSFVYFSSSSVKLPVQTMYSRTKRAGEEVLLSFAEKYNAPITIVRPYSVTGVGEQKTHLIPTLIRSCLDGESMNFVPEPTHDFIDVDDLVDGTLLLSSRRAKGVFELGTGQCYTNQQVKELVEDITGKKANIKKVLNMRDYDNTEWVARNVRARNMGWFPKKTLRQTITEMVEAYKATQ